MKYFSLLLLFIFECTILDEIDANDEIEISHVHYLTPSLPPNAFLAEHFDDGVKAFQRWIVSKSKKMGVDETVAKYDGEWSIESLEKHSLNKDFGLIMKSKAKHFAISRILEKPFYFNEQPLVVQYEVTFQHGQDCGGAYLKLITLDKKFDPVKFHEGTPYTIMFGFDKCGNDHKLHFIFRHVNPRNGSIAEKHANLNAEIEEAIRDAKPHLLRLVIRPDNSFAVWLDKKIVSSGSLLTDMDPPVNPSEEIDDPTDSRPEDWDDRQQIFDETAKRPEDWDESQPRMIPDADAKKPDDWLESEPEMIADINAKQPDDWDHEMDGDWEPPLIVNPKCKSVSGCGPWKPPMKENPLYKGKWSPPLIENPNYSGIWKPRRIANPDFFFDPHPFKMQPIGAVGFELWSMSDGLYFDNILISDNEKDADSWAKDTFDLKLENHNAKTASWWKRAAQFTNRYPWMWAVYVLLFGLPLVLLFTFCFRKPKKIDYKKTDEPTEDDVNEEASESLKEELLNEEFEDKVVERNTESSFEEMNEADRKELHSSSDDVTSSNTSSPRRRKAQKE